jgi:hypothetical protein
MEDEYPAVPDRRPEFEARSWNLYALLELPAQLRGFLRGKRPSDTPIDDGPAVSVAFDRSEVHAVGKIAVFQIEPGSHSLKRAPAGVLLARVVSKDGEHCDVGFRRDPATDGRDEAVTSIPR